MSVFLNFNCAILLLTLAVNLGLAVFVYLNNTRNAANRSFGGVIFSIAFWTITLLLFLYARDPQEALFLRRLTPLGPAILVAFLFYFSLVFPQTERPIAAFNKALIFLPAAVFSMLSPFTNLLISGIVIKKDVPLYFSRPVFGPLYKLYAFFIVCYLAMAIFNLLRCYRKTEGAERLQLRYLIIGAALTAVVGVFASLLLPLSGWIDIFTLGPVFTLFMAGVISYSVVRHRLLNVTTFLGQGLLFVNSIIALIMFFVFFINQLDFPSIVSFWAFMANLTLALYVYIYNPKSFINRIFSLLTLSVAGWVLGILIFRNFKEITPYTYFWASGYYMSGTLIPILLIAFSYVFPVERPRLTTAVKNTLWSIAGAAFLIIYFSRWIVKVIVLRPWGPEVLLGWFYNYFTFIYMLMMLYAFLQLFRKFISATGISRIQLKYVLIGMTIAALSGVSFNLILPLLGNYQLIWVGPNCTIFFVGFTAYAILKHRLMSIEIFIQRGTVYAVATILIMSLYALAVILSEIFFRKMIGYNSVLVTASAALLIAVIYQPLVRYIQHFTDRLFFRGRYDYQKTLREISQKIAAVIKLEELTRLIVSSFIETMKISEISFLLPDKEKEHFRSVSVSVPRYKSIEIDVGSPIVSWLVARGDVLAREEIEDEIVRQEALGQEGQLRQKNLEEVCDEMERLGIHVWVPIISKKELIGIIALGNKLSGDVFTTDDIGLLGTLASQTAVALDNARLYDEVLSMKNYSEEILQSMTNGLITTDVKGKIITYNYMAGKITSKKIGEVLGKNCEEIWGKRGALPQAVENTLKDRCLVNYETSIASPERGLVPIAISSTLLRDSHDKKMGALLAIQDLTEVKELEGKVRRADKLSALATMAAGMAHEIKNPLSSMKVFAQLLPKKYNDPEYRKKLEEIWPKEIDRIDRIVESLLGFARATTPTFEKHKFEDILEENLKYYEEKAKNSGVTIVRKYSELPEIEVDRSQLSQVFSNLILNAIQAMPDGGALTVETMPCKIIDNIIQSIKVRISDTGHGMPEEIKKKLFDPFFTTKYGGTGLGLTISHSIVDGHKGFIDVESQVGKGTAFTITLPVAQGLV